MPVMETVTIINKSGKVVSTGKHLVNIFKEAKEAYNEKKASLQAEHHARIKHKSNQKLLAAREETQSVASSRHSRSSHRSHRSHKDKGKEMTSRPPLTMRNLSMVSEGSVTSSTRSRRSKRSSSHHDEHRSPRSPLAGPSSYRAPYFENAEPSMIQRRHTDFPIHADPMSSQLSRSTLPPPYTSQLSPVHNSRQLAHRSSSVPDFHARNTNPDEEEIDMNLAYGKLPPDLLPSNPTLKDEQRQIELATTMSKLDALLIEAHCLQHSATAIITNLQANPEAMAAVALTLAEISNLLTKMSPGILTALKASSPAIFALLASPQFLIAGGVAIGVTVVMFGGYKIIKKIQASAAEMKAGPRMEEALVYEEIELSSIDSWRRGIAEVERESVGTSVDGEFITPEALRQKKAERKEKIRERERIAEEEGSVVSERTIRKMGSVSTIKRRAVPESASSRVAPSESGKSRVAPSDAGTSKSRVAPSEGGKSRKSSKGKEVMRIEGKKKGHTISDLFKKKEKSGGKRESELSVSHRPKLIEL